VRLAISFAFQDFVRSFMKVSRRIRYRSPALLVLGAVLAFTKPAYGFQPVFVDNTYRPQRGDLDMAPRYCMYTQLIRSAAPGGNNPEEIERWQSLMGETFIHMHHYCAALIETNRALYTSRSRQERLFYLDHSIYEFDYIIRNATPDFKLLPEIHTKKGQNLIRLDKGAQGIAELQRAIALKPDYWPPYAYISDYFKEVGDVASAREWLEKGLSASPNTKALTQRLAELNTPQSKRKNDPQPPAER
jgi:tetratricopeptide (TPR) repeat protein